jgi:hypothetical protein
LETRCLVGAGELLGQLPFAIETQRDILDRGDETDDAVFFAQRRDRHALLHVVEIFRGR